MPRITYLNHSKKPLPPAPKNRRKELLKRYIKHRKLTYDTLSQLVGICPNTLRWKISGEGIKTITAIELFRLISALSIPIEEVFEAWDGDLHDAKH